MIISCNFVQVMFKKMSQTIYVKELFGCFKEWLYEVLIHSQCIPYRRWWSACQILVCDILWLWGGRDNTLKQQSHTITQTNWLVVDQQVVVSFSYICFLDIYFIDPNPTTNKDSWEKCIVLISSWMLHCIYETWFCGPFFITNLHLVQLRVQFWFFTCCFLAVI